jgi:hypothetical protein
MGFTVVRGPVKGRRDQLPTYLVEVVKLPEKRLDTVSARMRASVRYDELNTRALFSDTRPLSQVAPAHHTTSTLFELPS